MRDQKLFLTVQSGALEKTTYVNITWLKYLIIQQPAQEGTKGWDNNNNMYRALISGLKTSWTVQWSWEIMIYIINVKLFNNISKLKTEIQVKQVNSFIDQLVLEHTLVSVALCNEAWCFSQKSSRFLSTFLRPDVHSKELFMEYLLESLHVYNPPHGHFYRSLLCGASRLFHDSASSNNKK